MQSAFLSPDDVAWRRALGRLRHDVYHLPAYVEFASRWQEPGTPLAFVAEEGDATFLLPMIVRPVPAALDGDAAWQDATCSRFYPGPIAGVANGPIPDGFLDRALDALVAGLRERRIVTLFDRCHPLLSPAPEILERVGSLVVHGDSVSIDLGLSLEELWGQTRDSHRRSINKGIRRGYRVRMDERWECLEAFVPIFEATMDRLDAAPHWRLDAAYFRALRAALGDALHLCVVELGDELVAGALISEVDGIAEYHLSGTAPEHVAASPSKLLIDYVRRWTKERGDRVLHLAGSLRPDDPLIYFKLGFSPLRHPVRSWRVAAIPEVEAMLTARRRGLARTTEPEPGPTDAFFPAYRRPIPASPVAEGAAVSAAVTIAPAAVGPADA